MAKRPTQVMPPDVRELFAERSLRGSYEDRPFYQRNDYLAWIKRAKRSQTREKRIQQMMDELASGGVYMGMTHAASQKR